jgi:hypothetical protein
MSCLLRIGQRAAQFRGSGGQQRNGFGDIAPSGGGADAELGRQLGEVTPAV